MKKLVLSFLMVGLLLNFSAFASATEIKLEGELIVQYLDGQIASTAIDRFFHLGATFDDPSADHSYLQLSGVVNEDISATVKFDVANFWGRGENATEEAYLTVRNLKGLPEGATLKAGLFYVPLGLQAWKYSPSVAVTGASNVPLSLRTDTGIEISGTQNEINYKIAYVDGNLDNGKDLIFRISGVYNNIPVGGSVYKGKVGQSKIDTISLDGAYSFSPQTSAQVEWMHYKAGDTKIDYSYLKLTHQINETLTGIGKYYEQNPKVTGTTSLKSYVLGLEYAYAENTTLKAEYIINEETSKKENNVIKAEVKVKF